MDYRFNLPSLSTLYSTYEGHSNEFINKLEQLSNSASDKSLWENFAEDIRNYELAATLVSNCELAVEGELHKKIVLAAYKLNMSSPDLNKQIRVLINAVKNCQAHIKKLAERVDVYPIELWKDWISVSEILGKKPHLVDIFVPEFKFGDISFADQIVDNGKVVGKRDLTQEERDRVSATLSQIEKIYDEYLKYQDSQTADGESARTELLKGIAQHFQNLERMHLTEGYQALFLAIKARIMLALVTQKTVNPIKNLIQDSIFDIQNRFLKNKNWPNKDLLRAILIDLVDVNVINNAKKSSTFQEVIQRFGIDSFVEKARSIISEDKVNIREVLNKSLPTFLALEKNLENAWNEFTNYKNEKEENLNEAQKLFREENNGKIIKFFNSYARFKDLVPKGVKEQLFRPIDVIVAKLRDGHLDYKNQYILTETAGYINLFGFYVKKYFEVEPQFVTELLKQTDRLMCALNSDPAKTQNELKEIGDVNWHYIGLETKELEASKPYQIAKTMVDKIISDLEKYFNSNNEKSLITDIPLTATNALNLLRMLNENEAARLIWYAKDVIEKLLADKPNVKLADEERQNVIEALTANTVFLDFLINNKTDNPRKPLEPIMQKLFSQEVSERAVAKVSKGIELKESGTELEKEYLDSKPHQSSMVVQSTSINEIKENVEDKSATTENTTVVKESVYEPVAEVVEEKVETTEQSIADSIFENAKNKVEPNGAHIYKMAEEARHSYEDIEKDEPIVSDIQEEYKPTIVETYPALHNAVYPDFVKSRIERDVLDIKNNDELSSDDNGIMIIRVQSGDLLSPVMTEQDKEEFGFDGNDINRYIKARNAALAGKINADQYRNLRRMFHTLKGTLRSLYLTKVQNYAYIMEHYYNDILSGLAEGELYPISKELLAVSDYVFFEECKMFEQLYLSNKEDKNSGVVDFDIGILEQLIDLLKAKDSQGVYNVLSAVYKAHNDINGEERLREVYQMIGNDIDNVAVENTDDDFISAEEMMAEKALYEKEGKPTLIIDEQEPVLEETADAPIESELEENVVTEQEHVEPAQVENIENTVVDNEQQVESNADVSSSDIEQEVEEPVIKRNFIDITDDEDVIEVSKDEDEENISGKDDSDVRFDESVSSEDESGEYSQFADQLGVQFDDEPKEPIAQEVGGSIGSNKVVYDALGEIIKQLAIIRDQFK
jgi:hypothetical protein